MDVAWNHKSAHSGVSMQLMTMIGIMPFTCLNWAPPLLEVGNAIGAQLVPTPAGAAFKMYP